jgi:hypothetical protein
VVPVVFWKCVRSALISAPGVPQAASGKRVTFPLARELARIWITLKLRSVWIADRFKESSRSLRAAARSKSI